MPAVTFTVPGCPVGKGRARADRRGHVYTPARTRSWEGVVRHEAMLAMDDAAPLDGEPLHMTVVAYMPIAARWSKRRQAAALAGELVPTTKPDTSNIAKGIEDALNGIVYRDDSLVTDLVVCKRYSDRPRVEVTVQPLAEIGGLPLRARDAA